MVAIQAVVMGLEVAPGPRTIQEVEEGRANAEIKVYEDRLPCETTVRRREKKACRRTESDGLKTCHLTPRRGAGGVVQGGGRSARLIVTLARNRLEGAM